MAEDKPRVSQAAIVFAVVSAVVVVLDQVTKYWAVANLTRAFDPIFGDPATSFGERLSRFLWTQHPTRSDPVIVSESFWSFTYAENPGAAWSFLASAPDWFRQPFFLVVSVAAMVFIVFYFRKVPGSNLPLRGALMLVFGGAVGNFIDRLRLGYVIDFIDWHYYDVYTWPTFNVADSAITVGVIIMVIEMLFSKDQVKLGDPASEKA
ncbi:MAG: signal peptidase II [Myxococcota bacterium]